jgi:hypothetical protein
VSLLISCVEVPDVSTHVTEVAASNGIAVNGIAVNRISALRVAAGQIAADELSDGRLDINRDAAEPLLATEAGREVLAALVGCALPAEITLAATVDDQDFAFRGGLGLARQWLTGPLDADSQRWVSACLFARVNAHGLAVQISLRGENDGLAVSDDERANFVLEEGGFFGNLFGPADEPIQWYACRGKDQASGELGRLIDRDCAEPDPVKPAFTQCGFNYVGDCGSFAAEPACESFAEKGTFYGQCHTGGGEVFSQVITTFVTR